MMLARSGMAIALLLVTVFGTVIGGGDTFIAAVVGALNRLVAM
jgi:hypothetical protein